MSNPSQAQGAAKGQRRTPRPRQSLRAQSLAWLAARMGRLGTLATFATLATLATACRPGSHGNASPTRTFSDGNFRWTLTRLEGATPETQVGWLDDETVLFIGTKHSIDGSPEISGLYAWNRKSPARLVLTDAYRFCFDGKTWTVRTGEPQPGRDDLIYRRYRLNPTDLSTTWIGPDQVGPSTGYLHPYTCSKEKRPTPLEAHHWDASAGWISGLRRRRQLQSGDFSNKSKPKVSDSTRAKDKVSIWENYKIFQIYRLLHYLRYGLFFRNPWRVEPDEEIPHLHSKPERIRAPNRCKCRPMVATIRRRQIHRNSQDGSRNQLQRRAPLTHLPKRRLPAKTRKCLYKTRSWNH